MESTTLIPFDPVKCEAEYKKYRQRNALGSKQLTGQTPVQWTFEGLCTSFHEFVNQVGMCMFYASLVGAGSPYGISRTPVSAGMSRSRPRSSFCLSRASRVLTCCPHVDPKYRNQTTVQHMLTMI